MSVASPSAASPVNALTTAERRPSPAPAPAPTVLYKRHVLKLGVDGSSLPRLVVVADARVYVCLPTGGITRGIDVGRVERVTLCPRSSTDSEGSSISESGSKTSPKRQTSTSFLASFFSRSSRHDDADGDDAPASPGRRKSHAEAGEGAWVSIVTLGIAQEAALALQFVRTEDGDAFVVALRRAAQLCALPAGAVVFNVPGEPGPTDAAGRPLASMPDRRQDPVVPRVLERCEAPEPAPRPLLSLRTSASAASMMPSADPVAETRPTAAGAGPSPPAVAQERSRPASASSASSPPSPRSCSTTPLQSPESTHTAEPASPEPLHAEEAGGAQSPVREDAVRVSYPPAPSSEVNPRAPSPPAPVPPPPPPAVLARAEDPDAPDAPPPLPLKETTATVELSVAATEEALPQARTPSPLRAVPRREAPAAPPQAPQPSQQQQQQPSLPVPPPLEFLPSAGEHDGTAASRSRKSASRGGSVDGRDDIGRQSSHRASEVRQGALQLQEPQPHAHHPASENHETVWTPSQNRQLLPCWNSAAPPPPRSAGSMEDEGAWLRRTEDLSIPSAATRATTRPRPSPEGLNETTQDMPSPARSQPVHAVADIDVLQAEVAAQAATVAQLRRSLHAHESLLLELAEVREERRRLRASEVAHTSHLKQVEAALAATQQEVNDLRRAHAREVADVEERLRQAHRAELEAVQDAFEEYDVRMSAHVNQLQREHREEAARWQHERRTLHYQLDEERQARQQLEQHRRHLPGVAPQTAELVAAAAQREAQRRLATSPHGQRADDPRTLTEAKLQRYEAQRSRGWPSPPRCAEERQEEGERVAPRTAGALAAGLLVSPPPRQQPLRTPRFSAHRLFDDEDGVQPVEHYGERQRDVMRRPPPAAEARPPLSYRGEHAPPPATAEAPARSTYTMHRRTYV